MKSVILFYVTLQGKTVEVKTYPYEYRSLMALLYDKFYLDDFGECKGIGRCGTCHVKVEGESNELKIRHRNEQTTLDKMENVDECSRLACQILVDEKIDRAHFILAREDDPGLY